MSWLDVQLRGWLQRIAFAFEALVYGRVRVPEVCVIERSTPTVKELCTVLAAIMCAPDTTEAQRLECANTLARFAFPERQRPSSGFLRTRGN